ncbi:hypothetical protein DRW07_00035 [Alteromonas sediminis]|uniref:Uncharacterized protein n=1 Tax=Alteromonas sediminis TaxID=2259342 RepID=A0A3N5Y453_9ALTE|nr:hypothetical protein [Alteromonas sediminis]RPJ67843.1 hypothetical protein DRW07_00035 [Alteromonas sediminis]
MVFKIRQPFYIKVFILLVVMMLTGCASKPNSNQVTAYKPTPPPPLRGELPTHLNKSNPEGLFSLNELQRSQFHAFFYDEDNTDIAPHKRLAHYLESQMSSFDYKGRTLKASQAMDEMEGNCLSLAIVTAGLAQSVGLKVQYRRVNTPPIYQRKNNILTLSSHVQTRVFSPNVPPHSDFANIILGSYAVIDYFPSSEYVVGKRVAQKDAIAMYYQNLAAEKMMKNQMQEALAYLYKGLSIAPQNASLLNAVAVVYKRQGFLKDALNVFAYGVEYSGGSLVLFENYAQLLASIGRVEEAEEIADKYSFVDDDNPFVWLDLAAEKEKKGNWRKASAYYRKAVEMGPYLHESHFGLAKSYSALGKEAAALRHMKKATALARYEEEQPLYSKKLVMMKHLHRG